MSTRCTRCGLLWRAMFLSLYMGLLALMSSPRASAQSLPTMDQISSAWKARQERLRSARVQWTETRFVPKGSQPPRMAGGAPTGKEDLAKLAPAPAADTSVDCCWTMLLDANMLSLSRRGSYWHPTRAEVARHVYISSFDGEISKSFYDEKGTNELSGFINKETRSKDFDSRTYFAMALSFRPCDLNMGGLDLRKYRVNPKLDSVEGLLCVVLSPAPPAQFGEGKKLWLDAARNFVPLRVEDAMRERRNVTTFTISYQEDRSGQWVASGWRWTEVGGITGRLFGQATATVTECSVNPDIPRSDFQIEFPAGTYVTDLRKATVERYVAREGGEKRTITNEEIRRGASYQELLSTESGMARVEPEETEGPRHLRLMLSVLSLAVLGGCTFVLWLLRGKRRTPSNSR